ncbi:hypothetical protein TrRE_jg13569, partial [Triparma retinervis]
AYPICIEALRRGVTAACMPTCHQIGGEAMLASGSNFENFSETFPPPKMDLLLDCKPSDVPQVKPRFFSTWCNNMYKSTFQAAASAAAEEAKQSNLRAQQAETTEDL